MVSLKHDSQCGEYLDVNYSVEKEDYYMMFQKQGEKSRNRDYIASFLVCGFSMMFFCIYSVTLYPNRSTLMTGDVLKQYIPALRAFVRSIWSGQGITYSWDLFCGMNATEFYGTYVGGSFVNLIYLVFPSMDPEVFLILAFTLKTAMAGLCFSFFCKKFWRIQGLRLVFFSLFYALCGYQFGINIINYIWMDALYLLPLILALIVDLWEKKSWLPLALAYCYLFLCNFYMGYVVGCFSALFFIGYYLLMKRKQGGFLQTAVRFAITPILAAGMAAFTLLPIGMFLLHHSPEDTTVANAALVQQDPLLWLSRFSFGIEVSNFVNLPYLYCGIPVFLLLVFFFGSSKVKAAEKLLFGGLFVIMLLSGMILPLYMFWHGFDNPDSWYHRYSFLIAFLCVAMACRASVDLPNMTTKKLVLLGLPEILIMTGINYYGCLRNSYQEMSKTLYSGGIALGWLIFVLVLLKVKEEYRKKIALVGLLLACVEVIANGCLEDRFYQDWQQKEIWEIENEAIVSALSQDQDFYRVAFTNEYNYSQDTYFGYKGISDFWSYENYPLKDTLHHLGAFTSPRLLRSMGLNPVTQLILGVKYSERTSGAKTMENAGVMGYQYENFLALGFMVSEEVSKVTFDEKEHLQEREPSLMNIVQERDPSLQNLVAQVSDQTGNREETELVENVFYNCNRLASAMAGKELEIFHRVPIEKISIEAHGVDLSIEEGEYVCRAIFEDEETKWLDIKVSDMDSEVYVAFEGNNTILTSNLPYLYDYSNPLDMGVVGVRYTKKLDVVNGQQVCTIAMAKGTTVDSVSCKEIQLYYVDNAALQQFYEILQPHQLQVLDYKNGFVHGKVSMEEPSSLLFTSIPYDDGWKVAQVQSDGSRTELEVVPLLDEAFLGIELPAAGEYELEFTYKAPGLKGGLLLSVISWLIFLGVAIGKHLWNRNNDRISTPI